MDAKMLQHVQTFHGKTRMRLGYAYSATTGDEGDGLSTEDGIQAHNRTSCSGPLDESPAKQNLSTDPTLLWEQERIRRYYTFAHVTIETVTKKFFAHEYKKGTGCVARVVVSSQPVDRFCI